MRRSPAINLLLFALTLLSTLVAGVQVANPHVQLGGLIPALASGLPYCGALLGILLAHEMGHYLTARAHGVDASLPYFIPVPIGFGTLGAVIRIRSALPSLRAVLDIGASGPIAGFLVGLPLLFWGYAHSEVVQGVPSTGPNAVYQSPFALAMALLRDQPLPWPPLEGEVQLMGDSLVTWLAARLTHGPLPAGSDLSLGPVALAAWIGMFVTTLNLTPVGQLDGGHVIYALFGRWAETVSKLFSWTLFGLGLFASWSWFVWWALTRFAVGVKHPPALEEGPLTPGRKAVAIASLAILVATFVPVPFYL